MKTTKNNATARIAGIHAALERGPKTFAQVAAMKNGKTRMAMFGVDCGAAPQEER